MRAWIVSEFGETSDVLKLDESAESFAPGPAQVKVKVEVAGLGLPDILMCRNNYPLVPPLPFTPHRKPSAKLWLLAQTPTHPCWADGYSVQP
jgi:NADPH:quinone reductase